MLFLRIDQLCLGSRGVLLLGIQFLGEPKNQLVDQVVLVKMESWKTEFDFAQRNHLNTSAQLDLQVEKNVCGFFIVIIRPNTLWKNPRLQEIQTSLLLQGILPWRLLQEVSFYLHLHICFQKLLRKEDSQCLTSMVRNPWLCLLQVIYGLVSVVAHKIVLVFFTFPFFRETQFWIMILVVIFRCFWSFRYLSQPSLS